MKKVVRITAWILGLVLLLQVGVMVVLQSPRVQTFLGKKVIGMLQDRMDAEITFQSASVRPFDAIVLDEVLVRDLAPTVEGMDTLLYVKHLSARFSIMGYFRGEQITVSRAHLDGGCFNLVLEEDPARPGHSSTNLQRIFRMEHKEDEGSDYHWGNILQARGLEVSDVHFRMENLVIAARYEERGYEVPEGTIDWNHLNLILEHIKVNHLRVADDLITCSVQDFYVHELATGLRMDNLSAKKVRVGKGNVHIEEFLAQMDPLTYLDIPSLDMDGTLDEDYNDFVENVCLDVVLRDGTFVDMQTISHFAPHMETMTFRGRIRGHMHGTVSDFTLSDMLVEGLDDAITLRTSGRMTGLPDAETTRLDFQVRELSFGLKDLDGFIAAWAPDVTLNTDHMAPGERFTVAGTVGGTLNCLRFAGDIDSRIGIAKADVSLDNVIEHTARPMSIGGLLETQNLQLGRILGSRELGALTLSTRLDATLTPGNPRIEIDTLGIQRFQALGYDYSGISAHGHYQKNDYDLHFLSTDPNLQLQADGTYNETPSRDGRLDASLRLAHANLQALNLDKRGRSRVALDADANLIRLDGRATGKLVTTNAVLENEEGAHVVPDITLDIDDRDSLHILSLRSGLLDADFVGDHPVTEFIADLRSLIVGRDLSALIPEKPKAYSGATYMADVRALRLQELLAFVAPGLYVESGTEARITVSPEGLLNADLTSGRLALKEQFIKDLNLHADNREFLTGAITSSVISLSAGTHLNNNRLVFSADDNKVGLGYTFENADEDTRAAFNASGELGRTDKGLCITARALPSLISYKGEDWDLSSGDINWCDGNITVDKLLARHEREQLLVEGGYSSTRPDSLSITMDRFDIGLVNTIAGDRIPKLQGRATGRALVVSSAGTSPGLIAGIVCDSTAIAGRPVGQLSLSSVWDEANQRFSGQLSNVLDGRSSIQAEAFLVPSTEQIHASMQMDRFELGYAEHFLNTIFHEFSGFLSGEIKLDGKLKDMHLSSQDLWLDDGKLMLDFTRVPYQVNGPLSLDSKGLHFNDMYVTDGEGGTGNVTGSIFLNLAHMDDIRMDTHVSIRDMRALALPRGVNSLAFGDVYATGKVDITGPMNKLTLAIDATSSSTRASDFHLPLGSASSGSSRELLTFTEGASTEEEDPYEQMMASARETRKQQSDFRFAARIKATPDLRVYIDIGDDNSLNAIGSGTIDLESRSAQGTFTMGGDYTIQDGSFHFSALNLVSRNFTLQDGSTIRFNGDIWDTDLDVKGRYTTKASLSNLLPSYEDEASSGASSRRTVYCGINITGKIRNPEVAFDIEVPDLNPIVQAEVESALNSEDKIQKQFVYLLIAGNFLPTDESGVTTSGSDVLLSNVTSIMSGQLNNIFQKLDIPLDLGLNYQTTQAGRDLFDVAVSTQLFNNRVIVNGTVGNKQLVGGATTNEVAGDLDIEIKLNRSGTLRVSLFSHSADQYTYYLDNSQRNGGGIAYQREFNSFGQFFREIFASRKQREAMTLEAAQKPQESVVLQIDTTGKSKVIHEIR